MKHTRFAVYAAAAIALMFALTMIGGCGGGGSKTNTITSPWNGSLLGVETHPLDGDLDAPLDAWINVYWIDGYYPPRQFTVSLQKEQSPGNWGTVRTRLRSDYSDPLLADWWLEPVSNFSEFTWYRIIIRSGGETVYAYFLTGDWYEDMTKSGSTKSASAAKSKSYRPAGATEGTGEGSETHTITVTK